MPEQHRRHEDHDHPRRLPDGPREPRVEQAARRDRRRQQQAEIVGQEERRQRRDDAAEGEEREERQEQPRQPEPQQVVAELRVVGELPGEPVRAAEDRGRDERGRCRRRATPREQVAALAAPRPVARRPELRQQQVRKAVWHHQTISSISCSPLPPVSLRNTGGQLARRGSPAIARTSSTVPLRDDPSLQDDADAVAHLLRHFERVRAHQDRDAVLAHAPEHVLDQPRAARIEADHRLVHGDRARPVQERGAHDEPLLHAVREALDQLVLPSRSSNRSSISCTRSAMPSPSMP